MDQSDDIAVLVFDGSDQPASADVLDLLDRRCSGVHEGLQAFPDIVDVIVDGHALLVPVRVQADVLLADFEADVIFAVGVRLFP